MVGLGPDILVDETLPCQRTGKIENDGCRTNAFVGRGQQAPPRDGQQELQVAVADARRDHQVMQQPLAGDRRELVRTEYVVRRHRGGARQRTRYGGAARGWPEGAEAKPAPTRASPRPYARLLYSRDAARRGGRPAAPRRSAQTGFWCPAPPARQARAPPR